MLLTFCIWCDIFMNLQTFIADVPGYLPQSAAGTGKKIFKPNKPKKQKRMYSHFSDGITYIEDYKKFYFSLLILQTYNDTDDRN